MLKQVRRDVLILKLLCSALGIAAEILFVRHDQKDWERKARPAGERPYLNS